VFEIQDGSQITGSSNNFAVFKDTHVVPKPIQGFMTIYETSTEWSKKWYPSFNFAITSVNVHQF